MRLIEIRILQKKESKKDKSLVLKISSGDAYMAYITKRFQKFVRKHGGFRKGGNISRTSNSSDIYHKCGKVGHFMRYCPMEKA